MLVVHLKYHERKELDMKNRLPCTSTVEKGE